MNKAKHAFGQSSGVEQALLDKKIDNYDILFLDGDTTPKVGWIDSKGVARIVPNGLSAEEVNAKIDEKLANIEYHYDGEDYVVSHKPEGTLVDYRDKEIRVMCPTGTQWVLQNSGEGSDANMYYIGVKAYAPSDDVVSFKEDLKQTIEDENVYYFEGEFAGVEENGRKYSIIWLPAAVYDGANWTYYGANSTTSKYIGWYYSVEWYNANGAVVASDCIRINLSNENCHSSVEPYYVKELETKIQEVTSGFEVVEF